MVKHSSRIELKQSALEANVNFIKNIIGKDVIFSSVVKANAYGHGIKEFVQIAEKSGVRHFSVASSFEAEEVLEATDGKSTIMLMGIIYTDDIPWAIEHDIEFFVYNFERLPEAVEASKKVGKKAKVHIEVETGSNRTGMHKKEFPKALSFLKDNQEHLIFQGLCTHLGGAESPSNQFKIDDQKKRYKAFLEICQENGIEPNIRHIACSAAAIAMPDTFYDLVRVGVAQYGFWPSPEIHYQYLSEHGKQEEDPLKRIFSWKTDIMDIREVPEGDYIGYGTVFQASHAMKIAVMPLGYSNGYPRALSNRGYVLIGGKKAPIVGLINMNLFMVDITQIPDAKVGDEVVLIGKQENEVINVSSFTDSTQLLNNEMMSRLPAAIPRTIVR
ncbi:alanine racemase [Marivirga sericea]|uniref:Alanine racemase n=1 Tax=Marivirga sericea TaxID=1028 RepID=A0A1X7IAR1_9BACT|nr:alanine racemase [Marivirga sericea]SMG11739.1 alanine racemase [Marivirga sericea]